MLRPVRASLLGPAALALALAGCASAPPSRSGSNPANPERLCIDRRDINVIRALDDRHALVKVGADKYFLLTVDRACNGMSLARSIGIVEATSRICGDGTSLLSFAEPTVGMMRCSIEMLDAVADRNAAVDLIRSRE
jgi:hypothetical protein